MQVALSDGETARAGGKVIKNVAGYDLSKLLTGSLGSLGPDPGAVAAPAPQAAGHRDRRRRNQRPRRPGQAALALTKAPLEARCLDLRFGGGDGALLARFGGATPRDGAEKAAGSDA